MGLQDFKITEGAISQYGVVSAPDRLIGDPQENKRVFDRLIRDVVKSMFNGLVDALLDTSAAGEIGAGVENVTGDNVQAILNSMKLMLDTKAPTADVTAALGLKADTSVTDTHVKDVEFDADTGKFRFVKQSGAVVEFDTALEKVATNWVYDAATQSLVLTLADGTTQRVSLSDFVTLTEFVSSGSIEFSVSGNTVTAAIKPGSVTDAMLDSALKAMLQDYVSQASTSAGEAAASAAAAAESARQAASSKSASERSAANAAESERQAALSEADAETYKLQAAESKRAAAQSESAAKDAQAAAEKARDEAKDIVGGDFMDKKVYDPQGKAQDVFKYVEDKIAAIPKPDVSAEINTHNTNDEAHGDIRNLIAGLTSRLNALADSDDITLDQLSEIVAYIKSNKTLIDAITTGKVNVSDIINNLTTNVANKPLSAAQGVALKALIDAAALAAAQAQSDATTAKTNAATALNKANEASTVSPETAAALGLSTDASVNDALLALSYVANWYVWEKYKLVETATWTETTATNFYVWSGSQPSGSVTWYCSDEFDVVDGQFVLKNPQAVSVSNAETAAALRGKYGIMNTPTTTANDKYMYKIAENATFTGGYSSVYYLACSSGVRFSDPVVVLEQSETQYVGSSDPNAYPQDGEVDGVHYKYVKQIGEAGAKIETGSYKGTDQSGSANPNRLAFSFEPKLLIISFNGYTSIFVKNHANANAYGALQQAYNSSAYAWTITPVTWSGNTVSWYSTDTSSGPSSQLNRASYTYHYVAIG